MRNKKARMIAKIGDCARDWNETKKCNKNWKYNSKYTQKNKIWKLTSNFCTLFTNMKLTSNE